MADPQNNQRADEEWIGKPHPAEPDEIGKAHAPVEFDDDDGEVIGKPVSANDRGRNIAQDAGANAPDGEDVPKRPKNPTK